MLDREELNIYLDRWMEDYGRPQHTTTLECLVDGLIEYVDGDRRTLAECQEEWFS